MNSNEQGNHRVAVPAALVAQLQNMAGDFTNAGPTAWQGPTPAPAPRPVSEISDSNADD